MTEPVEEIKKPKQTHLLRAKNNINDEYYTKYEDVKEFFTRCKSYIMDKKLYLPFDSKESNFIKYLKQNARNLRVEYKFTSDDYKNHEDLFEGADIVISNPPFSLLNREILPFLTARKIKWILVVPQLLAKNGVQYLMVNHADIGLREFIRPDGSITKVTAYICSNFINFNTDFLIFDKCQHTQKGVLFKKNQMTIDCLGRHEIIIPYSRYAHTHNIMGPCIDPREIPDWDNNEARFRYIHVKYGGALLPLIKKQMEELHGYTEEELKKTLTIDIY